MRAGSAASPTAQQSITTRSRAVTLFLCGDVMTGRDPVAGILIKLPPHKGPVTLTFDLHNRHTYSEEQVKAGRAFARYTATVGVLIGFDEGLAHLVEAGADMFLMPSRFEPCGMNQMYSQRYGTPPIANATGGLVDTIVDFDAAVVQGAATGFLMRQVTANALVGCVRRAVAVHRDAVQWRRLKNCTARSCC